MSYMPHKTENGSASVGDSEGPPLAQVAEGDTEHAVGYRSQPKSGSRTADPVISSMRVKNYRGFREFSMGDLGNINLIVGRNNTGKTSILEGLYILASGLSVGALWESLVNRGEVIIPRPVPNMPAIVEVDVGHLFLGHKIRLNSEFSISTANDSPREIRFRIIDLQQAHDAAGLPLTSEGNPPRLALQISLSGEPAPLVFPLSYTDSLRIDTLQNYYTASMQQQRSRSLGEAQFLTTESLNASQVSQSWQEIVLTKDEVLVTDALRLLEPRIDRIASAPISYAPMPGQPYAILTKGSILMKLLGDDIRLPIGNFGEGMWRIFAIAVALVRAKNSVLLVDEIDTGLHHTALTAMWKLVAKTAEDLNVQVFATTHSKDCVNSLASICHPDNEIGRPNVTIQRVERGNDRSIPFSEAEIVMAAESDIEIR